MEVHGTPRSAAKYRIRPKQRISHTKSRNGCYTCKQRRVKCDEERPTCGACSVRNEKCAFPDPEGTSDQRTRQPRRSRERPHLENIQPQASQNITNLTSRPLYLKEPQNVDSQSTSRLNMSDLYLLQHYILHTSKNMTLHKSKRVVWEYIIPEMAATNEFLMHLVLALAGLDLLTGGDRDTHARNDQRISNTSVAASEPQLHLIIEHHQQGLAGLQEALRVTSEPDAEALLAGSMLVAGFGFSSLGIKDLDPSTHASQDTLRSGPPSHSQPSLLNVGTLHIQWLQLVRGVTSILGQFWPTLRRCRLRALLSFNYANDDWKLCEAQVRSSMVPSRNIHSRRLRTFATGANHAVSRLRDLYASLRLAAGFEEETENLPSIATPQSDLSGNVGKVSLDAFEKAIGVVEDLYMRTLYVMHMKPLDCNDPSDHELQADIEDAAVAGWPHLLPEEFLSSLKASQPNFDTMQGVSLVILAHLYLTIALLDEIWYYGRRCDLEIYKINTLIDGLGDDKLISLMKWPIDVIQG